MNSIRQSLSPQTRLRQFVVDTVLGAGTFGITYLADDLDLDRRVVIKEYLPREIAMRDPQSAQVVPFEGCEHAYREGLERFWREVRTLARFDEPNIASILSFFRTDGTAYAVMRYEQGESLKQRLERDCAPWSENELIELARALLTGLSCVHGADFIHRDIKPGNIYLPRGGEPILIDFGAARTLPRQSQEELTAIYSIGYAPLEQYANDARLQGPWSDLYALGASLYRCATGASPIPANTRMAALQQGHPDPMPTACLRCRGQYSPALLELIDDLLQLQYAARPQSATAALERLPELGQSAAPDPVLPDPPRPDGPIPGAASTDEVADTESIDDVLRRRWPSGVRRLRLIPGTLLMLLILAVVWWLGNVDHNAAPTAAATQITLPVAAPADPVNAADGRLPGVGSGTLIITEPLPLPAPGDGAAGDTDREP